MLPSIPSRDKMRYLAIMSNGNLGYIATPKKRGVSLAVKDGIKYCIDNGVFGGDFSPVDFVDMLRRYQPYTNNCVFVTAPDVVGNWRETLKRFRIWRKAISNLGYSVAIVLQDGAQIDSIPWYYIDAVFIGGSTDWKLSQDVISILEHAGSLGLWRHVGRVNSVIRMMRFWDYAESFDGSGFAIEPGKIKKFQPYINWREKQCSMF